MDGPTGVTCDRCNARAFVVFTKGDDRLDFCLHHTHEHSAALRDLGYLRRELELLDVREARPSSKPGSPMLSPEDDRI